MTSFRLSSRSRRCLIALATSSGISLPVMATTPWSVTDGTTLDVTSGYTSATALDYPLFASGEGSLLQTTNPGLSFRTTGNLLYAATALAGGTIQLTGSALATNGTLAHGVSLNNGMISMEGGTIIVSGDNSAGIYGTNQSSATLDNVAVTADGRGGRGIILADGNLSVKNSTVLGTGEASQGIVLAYTSGGEVSATLDNVNVILRGQGTQAALMLGNGTLAGHQVNLSTTGQNRGLEIYNSGGGRGSVSLNNSVISTQDGDGVYLLRGDAALINTTVNTRNGMAVNVNQNAKVIISGGEFATEGNNAFGLWIASADSSADVSNALFTTRGDGAHAFHAQFGPATLVNSDLSTHGNGSYGLYSESTARTENTSIVTAGENSIGVFAARGGRIDLSNTDIETTGNNSSGLLAYPGSVINGDLAKVQTLGQDSHALWARAGELYLSNSQLVTQGENAAGLYISSIPSGEGSRATFDNVTMVSEKSAAIRTNGAGLDLELKNGTQLKGGNGILLDDLSSAGGQKQRVSLTADNHVVLQGDIRAASTNEVTLALSNQSQLTGAIHNVDSLNLDQSSTWVMTGNSSLDRFQHNGSAVFSHSGNNFLTLSLGSLSGDGAFSMNTDLAAMQGDLISVANTVSGNHLLYIRNSGREPEKSDSALTVVKSGGGSGQFTLNGGAVDAGTWQYELQQRDNNWVLAPKYKNGEGEEGAGEGELVPTPSTVTALGLFNATPTAWYGELDTLRTRMGDVRMGNDSGGAWVKMMGDKYDVNDRAGVSYTQHQSGISLGVDAIHPVSNGVMMTGLFSGVSRSTLDFTGNSHGTLNSFFIGGYGTWLLGSGWFIDAVAKANNFSSSADVQMNDGQRATGGYSVPAFGLSVEAGRHIPLDGGWFVEPSLQVSSLWVKGQSYTFSNALEASSGSVTSRQAALNGVVGKTLALRDGLQVQPWLRTAVIQEFSDDNEVRINGNKFRNDLSGMRGELGAGLSVQVNKEFQIYADTRYSHGSKIESPLGGNLGVRWAW